MPLCKDNHTMARTKQNAKMSTRGRAPLPIKTARASCARVKRSQRKTRRNRQTEVVIPKLPFQRLVREIAQCYKYALRFQPDALFAFQEATEDYMTKFMKTANRLAAHANRKTLKPKDMFLTRVIFDELY